MFSKINNVKSSVTKISKYLKLIRKLPYFKALKILLNFPSKVSAIIWNSLSSALNNVAFSEFKQAKALLVIKDCYAVKGKVFKRFHARAKGKNFQISKKTCKIFINLSFKPNL